MTGLHRSSRLQRVREPDMSGIARLDRGLTEDMSGAPRQRPAGGRPHQPELIIGNSHESLRGEACILSGWLAAASLGDLQERRVHGGHNFPARSLCSSPMPTGDASWSLDHTSLPWNKHPDDPIRGDPCVRGGFLAAVSPGDPPGRVHGGSASSPFFTASSSMLSLSSKEASRSLLDDIESCLTPVSRELLADDKLRLAKCLAAAKQLKTLLLLQLQQQLPLGLASGDIQHRAKHLLDTAMSSLAIELCHLRIWRLDVLRDHFGVSPVSIWECVRRSCSSGSNSGSAASWPGCSDSFTGTSGSDSSNGGNFNAYISALCEDMSVRSDKAFSGMDFIDRKSLSILNDIAGAMIEDGYEHMLRRAIDRHCAQLASYVEILDINNILDGHKEESKEILLKAWTTGMRIISGFLSEMQRQLNAQDLGYFNRLKEDYFLSIAKHSVMKLLKAATFICIQGPSIDPVYMDTYSALKPDLSKMVNVVMMYQALNYGMPTILALFSGQTKEVILAEGEGQIHRLSDMFVKLAVEQNHLVRSQCLDISDTGVHCSTRHIMDHMRMLVQHKSSVYLMLKGDQKAFCDLVVELISSLEFMLDMNSRGLQLQGQQQMFLLNNAHFMLQEVKRDNDLGTILGEGWLLQHHDQLNLFIAGYVDASWTPVMSCFQRRTRVPEILWPHQLFDKFTSSFEMTYAVQKTWKVTDPLIRHKVREAIFQKVIPEYRMHMENYSEKKQKSVRYSIEQLESQLQELFEG